MGVTLNGGKAKVLCVRSGAPLLFSLLLKVLAKAKNERNAIQIGKGEVK
jgi:hypothetical protein